MLFAIQSGTERHRAAQGGTEAPREHVPEIVVWCPVRPRHPGWPGGDPHTPPKKLGQMGQMGQMGQVNRIPPISDQPTASPKA